MSGTTPTTMLRAILLCMGCCLSGLILATVGGPVLDILHDQFSRMGLFDLPPAWDTTTHYMTLVDLFYVLPYLLPMFGLFVLMVTIYHWYQEEHEENEDEYWIRGGQM